MDHMSYEIGTHPEHNPTRMETIPSLTCGQILALPNGTELIAITVKMLGVGVDFRTTIINQEFKEKVMDAANHDTCEHGTTQADLEEVQFPGSIFILLAPEGYEPDINEIIHAKVTVLGKRHGKEGAPMFSEDGLRAHLNEDEWNDGSYKAYVSAYNVGSSSRKGR